MGLLGALLVAAAVALTVWQPIQVLPRAGVAPGYSLMDQHGDRFTSETARGTVTLYSFAPLDCGQRCAGLHATTAEVVSRVGAEVDLPGAGLRVVTIALDPVTDHAGLARAAAAAGADGRRWRWVGGDKEEIRTLVGAGFGRWYERGADGEIRFDPGFVLVDGSGVIRGRYGGPAPLPDADVLADHVGILADEIRNARGAAAVAYEAAHLFLCYP